MVRNLRSAKSILVVIMLVITGLLYWQMRSGAHVREHNLFIYHTGERSLDSLFEGVNGHFQSAGRCDHCHGFDPAGIASVSGKAGDINVVDDWSSTMMANSAKDPYWRAKVSHEVTTYPHLQAEIENTCTRCHAPLGHYDALMSGAEHYSISEMLGDGVALDGVSCLACHQQLPQPTVAQHTGKLFFNQDGHVYGQYISPLISPMAEYTGLSPEYASHISRSEVCAGCHSLITATVDENGVVTDNQFIEQATWHEWLNSGYPEMGVTCQACHMPQVDGPNVKLAVGYNTEPRPNFSLHTLTGGNALMLRLLRDNREELDIYASESQFNETISKTVDLLQNQSLFVELNEVNRTADTLYVDVKLTNRTGHKLPSGYPSRRMSVHLALKDPLGNEIFRSGGFNEDFYETGEDEVEPHYNIINSEDQIQIYEMVMGDEHGARTTLLNRAHHSIKDNRLVPFGFSTSHAQYDTTKIILGIADADFNYGPQEGSGSDIIHYHIPLNGYTGPAEVDVKVWFQSVPPTWAQDLLEVSTPEINAFSTMFQNADRSPVLMSANQLIVNEYVGVAERNGNWRPLVYVNGSRDIIVSSHLPVFAQCYDINGKLVDSKFMASGNSTWRAKLATGTYLIVLRSDSGQQSVHKIYIP
ncbi:MAG TPA: T9SS type A sorting domain-containing protein [Flavobacteriales bacterium]